MMWLKKWLAAPTFPDDEEKTRQATLLNIILLFGNAVMVVTLLFAVVAPLPLEYILPTAAMLVILLGLYVGMRRGYVRMITFSFCIITWLMVCRGTYANGGLMNPLLMGHAVVIVMAALLINARSSLIFGGLSVLNSVLLLYLTSLDYYPREVERITAVEVWTFYVTVFTTISLLLFIAVRNLKSALDHARQNRLAAETSNRELQREIMERVKIEQALRESEVRFHVALHNSPIVVFTQDLELRYTWIHNPRGNFSPHDVVGKTDADLFAPETAATLARMKRRVLESCHGMRQEIPAWSHPARGNQLLGIFDVTLEPMYDSDGEVVGITCASIDVTEHKRIEAERHEAELLRVELQKEKAMLKLKESFISMVSHEFRTPLTIALSSQELLAKYYQRFSVEKRQEYLTKIGEQIHYMVAMLDDILTLSKANAGMLEFQPAAINLERFCRELLDEVRALDGGSHRFVFNNHAVWPPYLVDSRLLRHILLNLLTNAAKYSPSDSEIQLELSKQGDEAILQVRDHGIGIPLDAQARLFEPFLRAANAENIKGTGLGLAIVKNSVEAHKGSITFTSRENEGTTFTVRIPLYESETLVTVQHAE